MNQLPTLALVPEGPTPAAIDLVLRDQATRRHNDELLLRYLASKRTQWRDGTIRVRRGYLNIYAEWLFPTPLAEATETQVLAFHDDLAVGASAISQYVSTLRGFYRWLVTKARPQIRIDDPTMLLEQPKLPRSQPRPMLAEDYQLALKRAVNRPDMYAWLGLTGCSGLRCCEIAWLRSGDIEQRFDRTGLLRIAGKGGHQRTVPVGVDLMRVLRPFLVESRGPVFPRPSDGLPHTPSRISELINQFLRQTGVAATAHQLRHRFGTDYHQIDPDVFRQADLMGHASIEMTRRYAAVSPTVAIRHVQALTRAQLGDTAARVGTRPNTPVRGRS